MVVGMGQRRMTFATHLAPSVLPLYAHLATHVGRVLGVRAELTVADSYERCAQQLDDVCFVCSMPYLLFERTGAIDMEVLAAPVLQGDRYGGRPIYFSDVVVRADSSFADLEDLRGATWAYNEPFSHSGFGVVAWSLLDRGLTFAHFGRVVEAGFHAVALEMVLDGQADAAAIDSQVLAIELRDRPTLRHRLRVVDVLGPSTIQPIVASNRRLSPGDRAAIRAALLSVNDDPTSRPILDGALVSHLVAVDAAAYDDVRTMLAAVERAGLLDARWAELDRLARLPSPADWPGIAPSPS